MSAQDTDATPATLNPSISVHERLASLERMVTSQQEEITAQHEEIIALHTELAARGASRTRALEATHGDGATDARSGRRASRRALLQLGGAAAAAGVAVAASGLSGHAPSARAAAELDSNYVQMGSSYQNFCATGTFIEPVSLSSPVTLLSVNNQSSLTSDTTHACGVLGGGPANSNGVIGLANGSSAYAIWGQTDHGFGVVGQSGTGVDFAAIGSGRFLQAEQLFAGAPTSGSWGAGEQIRDIRGDLWLCTFGGTPGTWVRVAVVSSGHTGGATTFLSTPIRLLDTRPGASGAADTPNAKIQPGASNTFHLPVAGASFGGVTIPPTAQALVGNCTVVNPVGVGDLAAYPDLLPLPNTAVMHYLTGQIVSNGITIGLGTNGKLAITALSAATDVIIDCQGIIV